MNIDIRNPGRTRRGGTVGRETFPDIEGFVEARWHGDKLRVRFDRDLTPAEEQTVRDRCESLTVAEEQLRGDSRVYLELRNPNARDTADQVRRLTRLLLGDDDETEQP